MTRLLSNLLQLAAGLIVGAAPAIVLTAWYNPSALTCPEGRGLVCVAAMFER